jgi:OOP family OmpA-OmpF porin
MIEVLIAQLRKLTVNSTHKSGLRPLTWHALTLALAVGMLFSATGHAQTSIESNQAGVNARIDVLGSLFTPLAATAASQSRVFLYRANNSTGLPGATSVFINGQYHTSLVAGGYSQLCLDPGNAEIGARQFKVGRSAKDSYDTVTATRLQAAQTQYFAVYEDMGRPLLKPVPSAQALRELASTRLQMHTISRVTQARTCIDATEPAVAMVPALPQQFSLSGDALFAFGKSDKAGLTLDGLNALDQLIARIRTDYSYINHIHVIGHADPLGSAVTNERLSAERANTVRRHIESVSQISARLTSEGRGSRQPVVTSCGRAVSASAIACNQPNRRVVVEVVGQRRADTAPR